MVFPRLETAREAKVAFAVMPKHSPTLSDIFQRANLTNDLRAVEQRLMDRAGSRSALLTAAGRYTVAAGGKRLRAALVLLSARLGQYDLVRALHPAVAVEMLHGASLVHDDLVDHTDQRRGRKTVHAQWDNQVALMLGDYLFAVSASELAFEPDPRIIRFYAEAALTVVEGELHPVTQLVPLDVALEQYRRKIAAKTGALFVAACKAGIAVAGGSDAEIEAMGVFGYELGMAFQIVDDVLDFIGDEAKLGKPAGNDLREGTLTLPLIYAVAYGKQPGLQPLVHSPIPHPDDVPALVDAVIRAGGIQRAMAEAHASAERALQALDRFGPSPARTACTEILQFVLDRQA
ncbi:polyprenyl synthetase family protein [Chloroflexia bacterium SDU3-3]|nr:polyprenyl synthetase family protein [Chloroflexia bacterium SDU3-3]